MNTAELIQRVKFVVDSNGDRTAAQLDSKSWDGLIALLESLEEVAPSQFPIVGEARMERIEVDIDEDLHNLSEHILRLDGNVVLVMTKEGRPVAEIRPIVSGESPRRPIGLAAGEFTVPDDFDDPLPEEVLREFLA